MPSAAKFGIVYASGSKAIRRIIIPDDYTTLIDGTHAVALGETLLVVSGSNHGLDACKAHVKEVTGVDPPELHCAVIRDNIVTAIICADPDIDSLPDAALVHHYSPEIDVGCKFNPTTGLFTTPRGKTIPRPPRGG